MQFSKYVELKALTLEAFLLKCPDLDTDDYQSKGYCYVNQLCLCISHAANQNNYFGTVIRIRKI